MLVGLQACHHQAADRKYDRADQIELHQFSDQHSLFRCETGDDDGIHDLLRKDGDQDGCQPCDDECQVGNAREQVPRSFASLCSEVIAHQRDECHRERAARDQCEQYVGRVVRGIEYIQQANFIFIDTRNNGYPYEGKYFIYKEKRPDQYGCTRKEGEFFHKLLVVGSRRDLDAGQLVSQQMHLVDKGWKALWTDIFCFTAKSQVQ